MIRKEGGKGKKKGFEGQKGMHRAIKSGLRNEEKETNWYTTQNSWNQVKG